MAGALPAKKGRPEREAGERVAAHAMTMEPPSRPGRRLEARDERRRERRVREGGRLHPRRARLRDRDPARELDSARGMGAREIRYEDLVLDTEPVLRRVCEFIELPWDDALLTYHERSATGSRRWRARCPPKAAQAAQRRAQDGDPRDDHKAAERRPGRARRTQMSAEQRASSRRWRVGYWPSSATRSGRGRGREGRCGPRSVRIGLVSEVVRERPGCRLAPASLRARRARP